MVLNAALLLIDYRGTELYNIILHVYMDPLCTVTNGKRREVG